MKVGDSVLHFDPMHPEIPGRWGSVLAVREDGKVDIEVEVEGVLYRVDAVLVLHSPDEAPSGTEFYAQIP